MQRRPVVADCPPPILLIDGPAEQRLVELGESRRIRAVQHYTLKTSDHARILGVRQRDLPLGIQDRPDKS
ncbi:hypothetical protein Scani_34990 [Streptomyces caniferus]|uniref:Uncharacterized protein n=1 Tax=Streptomyces caniferus TaxID=285557 RepID=A0A640S9X7_9ACTN|nr:hypothetical protein Scani_34990 [Streptomyces caniferus]